MPINEMLEIEAFDEDTVNELRSRARNALLVQAIASEEKVEGVDHETCCSSRAWTPSCAAKLAAKGVKTRDDLADLAVDELSEMTGIDEERAKSLIMAARAHWFADEAGGNAGAGDAEGGPVTWPRRTSPNLRAN